MSLKNETVHDLFDEIALTKEGREEKMCLCLPTKASE
jgi:hypothetical protein